MGVSRTRLSAWLEQVGRKGVPALVPKLLPQCLEGAEAHLNLAKQVSETHTLWKQDSHLAWFTIISSVASVLHVYEYRLLKREDFPAVNKFLRYSFSLIIKHLQETIYKCLLEFVPQLLSVLINEKCCLLEALFTGRPGNAKRHIQVSAVDNGLAKISFLCIGNFFSRRFEYEYGN